MQKYEIWIGYCSFGQGYSDTDAPTLVGTEEAINFQVACIKHELKSMLAGIQKQEQKGYVDHQSMEWFYKRSTNSNGWTGPYFETREAALATFTRK